MRTDQCNRCLRYRGDLDCDAFPKGIPEKVLTGELDHTQEVMGDKGLRFLPSPTGEALVKADVLVSHINDLVDREDIAYRRVKTILKRKGYKETDFEMDGPLYGWSTNELIKLAQPREAR